MRDNPDFVLTASTVVALVVGLVIGLLTSWVFLFAPVGLGLGLLIGSKLNPE
jgi:F0F1-type ATP synthase assembly protein I